MLEAPMTSTWYRLSRWIGWKCNYYWTRKKKASVATMLLLDKRHWLHAFPRRFRLRKCCWSFGQPKELGKCMALWDNLAKEDYYNKVIRIHWTLNISFILKRRWGEIGNVWRVIASLQVVARKGVIPFRQIPWVSGFQALWRTRWHWPLSFSTTTCCAVITTWPPNPPPPPQKPSLSSSTPSASTTSTARATNYASFRLTEEVSTSRWVY